MRAKNWIEGSGGMYTETPSRGARAGETVYKLRAWSKTRQKFAYFYLGLTLKQAEKRKREILGNVDAALIERETRAAAPAPTLEVLVKQFLTTYKAKGGTSDYYKNPSGSWIEHFGKQVPSDKITRAMVEDYRDSLRRQEYSDSTIRKYVGNLSTLYKWARNRNLVPDSPTLAWSRLGEGVRRPEEPHHSIDVVTHDEQEKWKEKADPQTRLLIDFYIGTGMRAGGRGDGDEGMSLKWSQVDRQGGAILITQSKTRRAREIPLNATLTQILGRVTRHVRSDYVLCDGAGRMLDYFIVERQLKSALERAGLRKQGGVFNLMRHTFGSRLAEKGHSFASIATVMGNSEDMCRRHYIRFSPGHLRAMMMTLDPVTVPPAAPPDLGTPGTRTEDQREVIGA